MGLCSPVGWRRAGQPPCTSLNEAIGTVETSSRAAQTSYARPDPEDGKSSVVRVSIFWDSRYRCPHGEWAGRWSLIYSNVLYEVPAEFFVGWPGGINRQTLDPYYQKVLDMMEARPTQSTSQRGLMSTRRRAKLCNGRHDRLSSHPLGHPAARLEWPKLAIQFGPRPGEERLTDKCEATVYNVRECNIGCNYHATLDLNYLARAANHGAIICPSAEVRAILPNADGSGYTVVYSDLETGRSWNASRPHGIVAAGSLGSTKLLPHRSTVTTT